jgi:hypothetical protein
MLARAVRGFSWGRVPLLARAARFQVGSLIAFAIGFLECTSFGGDAAREADAGPSAEAAAQACTPNAAPDGVEVADTRCGVPCAVDDPWLVDAFTVANGFVYMIDSGTKDLHERSSGADRTLNASSYVPLTSVLRADAASVYGAGGGDHWRIGISQGGEPAWISGTDGVLALGQDHLFFAKTDRVLRMRKDVGSKSELEALGATGVIGSAGAGAAWVAYDRDTQKQAIFFAVEGEPVRLAIANDVVALGGDGSHVYWLQDRRGVLRVSLAGGAVETIANDSARAYGLFVGSQDVYWVAERGAPRLAVLRVPKCGGTPEVVMRDLAAVVGLAADDRYLYVNELGTLHRVRQDR